MRLVKEMAADAKFQPALPREPLRLNEEEKKEIKKKKKKNHKVLCRQVQFNFFLTETVSATSMLRTASRTLPCVELRPATAPKHSEIMSKGQAVEKIKTGSREKINT